MSARVGRIVDVQNVVAGVARDVCITQRWMECSSAATAPWRSLTPPGAGAGGRGGHAGALVRGGRVVTLDELRAETG
jgi:hypothetical protein